MTVPMLFLWWRLMTYGGKHVFLFIFTGLSCECLANYLSRQTDGKGLPICQKCLPDQVSHTFLNQQFLNQCG